VVPPACLLRPLFGLDVDARHLVQVSLSSKGLPGATHGARRAY
jgi:hypothetical protein